MVVELCTASYAYSGAKTRQVEEVSFRLEAGTATALVGPSGAGKSTLLQGLQGFLRPVAGQLLLGRRDPWRRGGRGLFGSIGTLLQDPGHQLFAPTVKLDVAFGLRRLHLGAAESARKVTEALGRVGLDPEVHGERSPWELSGGEKRRAALAGLLVTAPEVLLLDEPTAGLDAPSRRALFGDLERLVGQGTTVLWTSHDLEDVWSHAPRVLVLDQGRLVADGPPTEVLADDELAGRLGWDALPVLAYARRWGVAPHADPEVLADRVEEAWRARTL